MRTGLGRALLAGYLGCVALGAGVAAWCSPAAPGIQALYALFSAAVCACWWCKPHPSLESGRLLLTINGNALLRQGNGRLRRGRLCARSWSSRYLLVLAVRLHGGHRNKVLVLRRGQADQYRRLVVWCRHLDVDKFV